MTTTDGSGYTVVLTGLDAANNPQATIYDKSGNTFPGGLPPQPFIYIQDPDGAQISWSQTQQSSIQTLTDTLDTTPLTYDGSGGPAVLKWTWQDASNHTQVIQINSTQKTQKTAFGCANTYEVASTTLYAPTSIQTPMGTYYLSYEQTPNNPSSITGRIASITYPTGGKVSYTYAGGNNGVLCGVGSVPILTRKIYDPTSNTTSTWTYSSTAGDSWGNTAITVTDPANNQIQYTMNAGFQTKKQVYQGSIAPANLLQTVITCYNGTNTSQSGCSGVGRSATSQPPVTQIDEYTYLGSSTSPSLVETIYDCKTQTPCYGNVVSVARYNFGATFPASGSPVTTTTTTYNIPSGGVYPCGTLSNPYIFDRPCSVTTTGSNGRMISQTKYTYNGTGHVLTTSQWVSGTGASAKYVATSTSYNSNGTVNVATNSTGATFTYSYDGSCNSLMPTGVTTSANNVTLSRTMSWDCNGAVQTGLTDENGSVTHTNFFNGSTADPFYRPMSDVDAITPPNTTNYSYSATTFEGAMNFNGTTSTTDNLAVADGLGRPIFAQTRQAQGSSTFDTTQTNYGWTTTTSTIAGGPFTTKSLTYSGTVGQQAPSGTPVTTTQYDALNRPISVTDAGGGITTHTYVNNDDLIAIGPKPNNENLKQRQLEYDGLGRLTSVCEVTSSANGGAPCVQNAPATGYKTSYAYSTPAAGGSQMVVTQGAQTRTYVYDGLGRLTSETNPESGTKNYIYDTATSTCGSGVALGSPVETIDNAGVHTCFGIDALGRVFMQFAKTSGGPTGTCRYYIFGDQSYTPPSGVTITNGKARVVEAYTTAPSGSNACNSVGPTTDEWFSYDANGQMTDMWEYTPLTGAYYHTAASYYPNGVPKTLSGLPGYATLTYGVDGEGRWNTATLGTIAIVSAVTYGPTGPTEIDIGAGTDKDKYWYDAMGRVQQYQFFVGSQNNLGILNWNPNGTLQSLAITDGFNSADTQTCTFGYDDLSRLTSDNCGSVWSQTYSYDQYGNLTKSGSASFACAGCYNPVNNQFQTIGATYDANGNLTYDGAANHYTWDGYGKLASVTYDAFGRPTTNLYTPLGKVGVFQNSTTLWNAYVPLPGGGAMSLGCCSSTNIWYLHRDWLGTSRVISGVPASGNGSVYNDRSFSPFGDVYLNSGYNDALFFAGMNSDIYAMSGTSAPLYDTPNRELAKNAGRWLSPDPAGLAAANPSNPQSWNRYAYALNNPLLFRDPLGLWCAYLSDSGDRVESMDDNSNDNECGSNGGYWIEGSYGGGSWLNINLNTGRVMGLGYDSNGNSEISVAGAMGSNNWGAWTQTFNAPGLQNPAANNGPSWWGTFFSTLGNGLLHGVRQPGQSFTECVNQNVSDTTFGTVDPQKLFNQGLNIAEETAALLTATNLKTAVGPSVPLGPYVAGQLARMAGLGSTGTAVAIRAAAATGTTLAVAGAATAGAAIGSAINCR
ncbi:MAG TPA: RHS repeat-associated core domain-containing protein [Candidatus Binatia bacterium]|nr:RHS repeat-associated core domain-containing protein [Candidatus Binatia bacterium]